MKTKIKSFFVNALGFFNRHPFPFPILENILPAFLAFIKEYFSIIFWIAYFLILGLLALRFL